MSYRYATMDDLPEILPLISKSFIDYPVYAIAFQEKFQSRKQYFSFLHKMHRVEITPYIQQRLCYVAVVEGKIVAAALVKSPLFRPTSWLNAIKAGALSLVTSFWSRNIAKLLQFLSLAKQDCQHRFSNHSWYLEMLAVSEKMQGKRVGTRFIEEFIVPEIKRHHGKQLFLITNTKQNCAFYRKNKFQQFSHKVHLLNRHPLENWSFVRTLS